MTADPAESAHVRWPPERFYWAVLDGAVLAGGPSGFGRRKRSERLGYLFEAVLPGVSIEDVQAVYAPMPGAGRRYLACGVPRATLDEVVNGSALTLTPVGLPPFVGDDVDPARLNLLTGPYAPSRVRRVARRALIVAAVATIACAVLLTVGLERRAAALDADAGRLAEAEMQVYEKVLGRSVRAAAGTSFPPARRLIVELRKLEATRSAGAPVPDDANCAFILAEVLACWPADVRVRTDQLTVNASSVVIRGTVPTMSDAQDLANALAAARGWVVALPETQVKRDGVQVTLRLSPRTVAGAGGEDRP